MADSNKPNSRSQTPRLNTRKGNFNKCLNYKQNGFPTLTALHEFFFCCLHRKQIDFRLSVICFLLTYYAYERKVAE